MTTEELGEKLAEVQEVLELASELAAAIVNAQPPYDETPDVHPLSAESLAEDIGLDLSDPEANHDLAKAMALLRAMGYAATTEQEDGSFLVMVLEGSPEPSQDPDFATLERALRNGQAHYA
jgi:hypothetical protein